MGATVSLSIGFSGIAEYVIRGQLRSSYPATLIRSYSRVLLLHTPSARDKMSLGVFFIWFCFWESCSFDRGSENWIKNVGEKKCMYNAWPNWRSHLVHNFCLCIDHVKRVKFCYEKLLVNKNSYHRPECDLCVESLIFGRWREVTVFHGLAKPVALQSRADSNPHILHIIQVATLSKT